MAGFHDIQNILRGKQIRIGNSRKSLASFRILLLRAIKIGKPYYVIIHLLTIFFIRYRLIVLIEAIFFKKYGIIKMSYLQSSLKSNKDKDY